MNTRAEIIKETFDLTMKYGVKSVSMDDIAKQNGISKKTIYQHFENKKELVREMVIATIEKDEADITEIIKKSKDAIDEIVNIASHVLHFLRGMSQTMVYDIQKYYAKEWQLVENHHDGFIYGVIKKNLKRGIEEGWYLEDVNPEIIAKIYVGTSHLITNEQVFPLKDFSKSDLFKNLITYHIRGIVSKKGQTYLQKLKID